MNLIENLKWLLERLENRRISLEECERDIIKIVLLYIITESLASGLLPIMMLQRISGC